MDLYNVEVKTTLVVAANSSSEAKIVAIKNARQAISDCDPDAKVLGLIEREDQLIDSWDVECTPYGGNGNDPISKYLEG